MTDATDRDALAGEYALGLIEGEERVVFERRMEQDAALGAAVERWRTRLAPIDVTAPPVTPPPGLWPRIEQGLGARAAVRSRPSLGKRLGRWWDSLPLWRGAAAAGAFASVLMAIGLVVSLNAARRQPVMVAVLLTEANSAAGVVNVFADRRVELLPLQQIGVPPGRALEIWTLWDREKGPRSVGLIDSARTVPLRLDDLPLGADQLFEITVEPAGGSPIGRPTGPIVAKGLTTRRL